VSGAAALISSGLNSDLHHTTLYGVDGTTSLASLLAQCVTETVPFSAELYEKQMLVFLCSLLEAGVIYCASRSLNSVHHILHAT